MNEQQRRAELSEFLRTRRARLTPELVGMPLTRRRTPGLRREEVAERAGVSTACYTYLEQGRDVHVSRSGLESIADALQLTGDERIHLSWLADQPLPPEMPALVEAISPVYQRTLDLMEWTPAYITGRRSDILGWNKAASIVFGDFALFLPPAKPYLLLKILNNPPTSFAHLHKGATDVKEIFCTRPIPPSGRARQTDAYSVLDGG